MGKLTGEEVGLLPCNVMDIRPRVIVQKVIHSFLFLIVVIVVVIQQDKILVLLQVRLKGRRQRVKPGLQGGWSLSRRERSERV